MQKVQQQQPTIGHHDPGLASLNAGNDDEGELLSQHGAADCEGEQCAHITSAEQTLSKQRSADTGR